MSLQSVAMPCDTTWPGELFESSTPCMHHRMLPHAALPTPGRLRRFPLPGDTRGAREGAREKGGWTAQQVCSLLCWLLSPPASPRSGATSAVWCSIELTTQQVSPRPKSPHCIGSRSTLGFMSIRLVGLSLHGRDVRPSLVPRVVI